MKYFQVFRNQFINSLEYNSEAIDFLIAKSYGISKSEAKRLISANGIQINKDRVKLANAPISDLTLLKNKYLLIQKGKSFVVVEVV
ncbi:MAG: hypothetical protein IPH20_14255 [Bacteroidales bacterium]|nr:hypothetical protein [Bacteroidales bacterium]